MPPHDTLWKSLIQIFFASFLRWLAPELSGARFRFLDKELLPEGPKGERREVDVLARVVPPGKPPVRVHVEIEVRYRADSLRRLRRYYHLLEARHGEPVLSVLLALRGGPHGMALRSQEEVTFAGRRRSFDYLQIGVAGLDADELLASPEPIAWALATLVPCRAAVRLRRKLACWRRIASAGSPTDKERFLLVNAVETYLNLDEEQAALYERWKLREENRAMHKIERTWADRKFEEGRSVGVEQGREAGLEEGSRRLLEHLLRQRFGPLSAATAARVAAIRSVGQLTRLAEKVLVARSLEEMGLAG
jgi:hypothetical protein